MVALDGTNAVTRVKIPAGPIQNHAPVPASQAATATRVATMDVEDLADPARTPKSASVANVCAKPIVPTKSVGPTDVEEHVEHVPRDPHAREPYASKTFKDAETLT